jgi:hypothetical protein
MESLKDSHFEKRDILRSKLINIYTNKYKYQQLLTFAEDLKTKHADCLDYDYYHLLIGSTPWEDLTKVDFDGEDSIEIFIDSLE